MPIVVVAEVVADAVAEVVLIVVIFTVGAFAYTVAIDDVLSVVCSLIGSFGIFDVVIVDVASILATVDSFICTDAVVSVIVVSVFVSSFVSAVVVVSFVMLFG